MLSDGEKMGNRARMDVIKAVKRLLWSLSIMLVSGTRKILKEIRKIWKNQ